MPRHQQEQQPSEVQIILDDALTDLEALVDQYLPGTSSDGGFAGRMMAAIEQVGASATKSIGGGLAAVVPDTPGSGRRSQPTRSRSNTSSRSQYSESSVEVSYDERTDDSEYDTNDTKSCYSSASASEELKPVAAVVVRNKDKSKSNAGMVTGKDELMNQTIDTAVSTTVDALDTSYFAQDDEEEPATIPPAAPSSNVATDDLDVDEAAAAMDGPLLPESPRRKAEREADEAAERLAHRSYFSKMSSFDQLFDETTSSDKVETTASKTNTTTPPPSIEAPRNDPDDGNAVAEKTQHELVQKYRQEKKQQMAEGTTADDEFATEAGVERRREERRAEERRRLAAVAEHRRRLKYNAQKLREANAAGAEKKSKVVQNNKTGSPPPGLNASDDSESTADSLADDLQSMVVTDLD